MPAGDATGPSRGIAARPVLVSQVAVAVFVAIKLYIAVASPPIGDEAYYWMWGQKLAWSYFDHPPLHAWLLRLMDVLFGWNLFSLRVLTWVTFAGTLGIFWLWCRRLKPDDPAAWFWPTVAIYLASPMFLWTGSISFHDHLLTFLCLVSGSLFLVFAERWEATGRGFGWLYGGAAALGLATLTKYNGALLGIGIAVFFATRRELRPLWRSPHLYLAALLSVALQAPVFWWNLTEGFASYKFHLGERWGGSMLSFKPLSFLTFVILTIGVVGPFLIPAIVRFVRRTVEDPFATRARQLALSVLAVSSAVMAVLSFMIPVFFYWNIVAFTLAMPLVAGWMKWRPLAYAHYLCGIVVALAYCWHATIDPAGDWTIKSTFGWPQVAERVRELEKANPVGFVAATRYTTAAQLGFAMRDPDVVALAARHDQYDFWFDRGAHDGQDALIVTDDRLGLDEVSAQFDSITPLDIVEITQFGRLVYRVQLFLGHRFRPTTAS